MIKEDLDKLRQSILESVALVNSMISKGIQGLKERNKNLLKELMEKDESREKEFEIELLINLPKNSNYLCHRETIGPQFLGYFFYQI